ncbi:flagellar protein FlgN [Sphingomonas sp.]|jgi:flagellar biosynthesis/type III secretory pathway chaperone|uniref:flagellar protein FlgN n=1 Tax=Sphingomonas sp. TaxID=28214 RepID=UPI003562F2BA
MADELIDLATSLSHLMEQESEALALSGRMPALSELVAAKVRLVGQIEAEVSRRQRETPDWADTATDEQRAEMALAFGHLRDASIVNAQILERQIAFSTELMGAIAAEAQRVTGKRSSTYGASGGMTRIELPAPISINARL